MVEDLGEGMVRLGISVVQQLNDNIDNPASIDEAIFRIQQESLRDEEELESLRAAYERAKGGHGQVVLIEGEAGIGKSRLVDEFIRRRKRRDEDLNFLFGSYPPGGAATAAGAAGSAIVNREPCPGSLSTQIRPPIIATSRAHIAKPSPVPPY